MSNVLLSLGLAGVFFGAIAFRGIFGYLKNQKIAIEDIKFDWKKFLSGSIRPITLTLGVGALTGLVLLFLQLIGMAGIQVIGLEQISIENILIGLAIADVGALGYAIKEMLLCFGLSEKQIAQIREVSGNLEDGQETGIQIGQDENGDIYAYATAITPDNIKNEQATDDGAEQEASKVQEEVGLGGGNPLARRLPDGDNDNGKGWQCSKYSYYLATGIRMNYAPHPDYGPCNGRDIVDYLVNKCGFKRCGKINGAIFAYNAGKYGHTGMVLDASSNLVNDANWNPLRVGTHNINLDAVGAVYCCSPDMSPNPTPAPKPAPTPTPSTKKSNEEIANEVIQGKWGNGQDRKNRLTAAGYDYNAIQAIVDKKMTGGSTSGGGFKVGDKVVPTKLVDYNGTPLKQYDSVYTISQLSGDRAVLTARGAVWAAMNTKNIRKA